MNNKNTINPELQELQIFLENNMYKLKGAFVKKNSGYDKLICDELDEFTVQTCRYWDATWKSSLIEFKKGKSIWLDLLRYSEISHSRFKKNHNMIILKAEYQFSVFR